MLILKFYTVRVRLHDVKRFLNQKNSFKQTRVDLFLSQKKMMSFLNYVTTTLRVFFVWRSSIAFAGALYMLNYPFIYSSDEWKVTESWWLTCI